MSNPTRDRLLLIANAYATARGLSMARVSTLAGNDGKILARLANGRDITTGTYDSMVRWFSDNWPENLAWPDGVERPAVLLPAEAA